MPPKKRDEPKRLLGQFEETIVLAVLLLQTQNEAYGLALVEEIGQRTGREPTLGAAYVTLQRLEDKGFLTSHMSPPTPERGGRSKRLYQVTGLGQEALNQTELSRSSLRIWPQTG